LLTTETERHRDTEEIEMLIYSGVSVLFLLATLCHCASVVQSVF